MFLSQCGHHPGYHVLGIADLSADRARATLDRVGWPKERYDAPDAATALAQKKTWITEDADALIEADGLEVLIDATGNPAAGIRHALKGIENGRHLVMVNVEADVLAGPLLAKKAEQAGLVYSLAYGDQPALIAEMVDWGRTVGMDIVCAGKGTKYLPAYHHVTPNDVWTHYGLTPEQAKAGGMNPQMFNSFLDGTKSAYRSTCSDPWSTKMRGLNGSWSWCDRGSGPPTNLPYCLGRRIAGLSIAENDAGGPGG